MYHYTESGLSNVSLVNGYTEKETPYGDAVAIDDVDALHAAIGADLIKSPARLTGEEVRFLRQEMDLTQANLAKELKVDGQTVARWEKGESEISGPADGLIRVLYAWHEDKPEVKEFFGRLADQEDIQVRERAFERVAEDGHWTIAA